MQFNHLLVTSGAGITRVTLNRPERRNALSLEMLDELGNALRFAADKPETRVIVVDGAGPVFSAGHDLAEMLDQPADFYDLLFRTCTNVMLEVQRIPQPVIAKVHGFATAAGCQLVAACDLAVASSDARFATPGIRIGLFCSTPMVPVSRAIGRKRAMQMLLTGDSIDAETAKEWGLINDTVPAEDLDAVTYALARKIMQFSGEVIGIGKQAFYAQLNVAEQAAYEIVEPIMSQNAQHVDAQEGMRAFLDKRSPEWPSQQVDGTGRLQI